MQGALNKSFPFPLPEPHAPCYYDADVKDVPDEEYRALLGRDIPPRIHRRKDKFTSESCFGILETELLNLQKFDSVEHFKAESEDYLDYYNIR